MLPTLDILARSLDSLHFLFFQLIFFFAYHHLLNIPSLSTVVFKYLYEKTLSSQKPQLLKSNKTKIEESNDVDPPEVIKSRDVIKTFTKTPLIVASERCFVSYKKSAEPEADNSRFLNSMLTEILNLVDQKNFEWRLLHEDKNTDMKIYQHSSINYCYKVVSTMDNTPETTYDLLADVTRRSEWDHLAKEGKVLEVTGESTRVHYFRTKAMFPTLARDAVTLAYGTQLDDGRMVHVNKSIEHKLSPNEPGVIRIHVNCAGFVVEPIKSQQNKCYLTQIIDADPKGWVPKYVISLKEAVNETNKSSIGRPGNAPGGNEFWKSFIQKIATIGDNTKGRSGKIFITTVTYAAVIIFGVRKWRSKNSV
ncbi:7569_t:CDS:2 [Acaulospora morrowiae]|uniref:7569_t:CDS:1 n=1 Tax=Acaulospora morrowiae TaxID=94023 RepID=A0A9N9C8U1_9GLOM|nr:7569_t:CDS:2 [Acaulospora morrowiae]